MSNSQFYYDFWKEQLPSIKKFLESDENYHYIYFSSDDFDSLGNRVKYSFNLEYINGINSNNINGSAVARDLDTAINRDKEICNLIKVGHFKFNMSTNFIFKMHKL